MNIRYTTTKSANWQGGYTLLFAVIVSTMVLSIGLAILNIARKELLLTSAAQESQKAVYAADAGVECAYFYDVVINAFQYPDSTDINDRPTSAPAASITCDQTTTLVTAAVMGYTDPYDNNAQRWSFVYGPFAFNSSDNESNPQCTEVRVIKRFQWNETVQLHIPITIIESKGYNIEMQTVSGRGNCRAEYPFKVERAIQAVY